MNPHSVSLGRNEHGSASDHGHKSLGTLWKPQKVVVQNPDYATVVKVGLEASCAASFLQFSLSYAIDQIGELKYFYLEETLWERSYFLLCGS